MLSPNLTSTWYAESEATMGEFGVSFKLLAFMYSFLKPHFFPTFLNFSNFFKVQVFFSTPSAQSFQQKA